ncbi:MAG: hypothetical protein MUO95_03185, partial [Methanoregula sp.]|nr:hypothetical protein [Methanoregula sp.]
MTYGLSDFVKQYTKKGSISVNQAGVIAFLCSPSIYGPQRKVEKGKFTKKEQLKIYEKLSIEYIEDESRDRLKDATDFATSL